METRCATPLSLTQHCGTWTALQRVNDDLVSPFFHPEFTRNVARARPAAEVTIIHDGAALLAFSLSNAGQRCSGDRSVGLGFYPTITASGFERLFAWDNGLQHPEANEGGLHPAHL
jgi:hypothetical protein